MSCQYIETLATGIWETINSPASPSVYSISGRLVSSGFLGQLDIRINGCHYIESGCIYPPLNRDEQAIYEQLYLAQYYRTKSLQGFADPALGGIDWIRIQENDSVVARANPNEVAKYWRSLYQDANNEVKTLSDLYKRNRAIPRSVDYLTIEKRPNGGTLGERFTPSN